MAPGIGSTWREEEDIYHGAAAAPKLHLHPGGLTGLAVAFVVAPLAVSEPPPGVGEKTYFLALWGVFIAGMAQIIAAVWLSNNGPPCRRCAAVATATQLMYCASVAAIVVTASLSAASLSLPW